MRNSIEIYDVNRMNKLRTLNIYSPLGRFSLSPDPEESLLAYSTDIVTGKLHVYNLTCLSQELELKAHHSPIILLCFNQRGSLLATASCNEVMVRVFAMPKGTRLYSAHRGIGARDISSISFSANSALLGISSAAGLVQVYQLRKPRGSCRENEESEEENLNDCSEKNQSEVSAKEPSAGLCGLRFFLNKLKSFFVSTSLEHINAIRPIVIHKSECRKRRNIMSLQNDKIVIFTKDWIYSEFGLDLGKRRVTGVDSKNLELLQFE
eukprot:TRINITY_DN1139_c0_g1_i3.p1 TRINITY_DN1139_c0_g1~~TRINITY_DN1139_c0_g1_i3.p1  ORF type:complete len:265 (+),score=52.79 TRINITY_DN1139_c0_g1_i3:535-1329(+)